MNIWQAARRVQVVAGKKYFLVPAAWGPGVQGMSQRERPSLRLKNSQFEIKNGDEIIVY